MKRTLILFVFIATVLVLLLAACEKIQGDRMTIDVSPDGAFVTVRSDLDGSLIYEGYGDVTLTGLLPGSYLVMTGDGDETVVEFVTIPLRERSRATIQLLGRGPGGPGGGGGGGGHTEALGNNLSFPVIWAENGSSLVAPGDFGKPKLTIPYDVTGDGSITEADKIEGFYQFAQKVEGNAWQAESAVAQNMPVYITEVDWGDSLESVDMKLGRPVRVELSLYKMLATTYTGEASLPVSMVSFSMTMLANPSSPNEIQGAGASQYPVDLTAIPPVGSLDMVNTVLLGEATIYSAGAQLIIQPLIGAREDVEEGDLVWNGGMWEDADATDPTSVNPPLTNITFAGELNVGGKVIFGLSKGGWRPKATGDYRITFYLQPTVNTQMDYATIRESIEEAAIIMAAEPGGGGTGVILSGPDPVSTIDRNLTYIDIRVVAGGGGGGGKPRK